MTLSGPELYRRARQRIPGGTQLLSKRPEMFLPEHWPSYYERASGAEVWDLSGNRYIDMSYCGIGACVLGFADPDVDSAVCQAVRKGSMSTLNCAEEVELADLLCELHPWADMARFARCGGEAMAIAVRIARASTGLDKIAICGYHGWHDWYLAANLGESTALDGHLLPGLEPVGVPRALRGTTLPFHYNDVQEFDSLIDRHGGQLAAIVMEPVRDRAPAEGFLEHIREVSRSIGAVLIFDEITSGWRVNTGGAHLLFGISPDIAVFSKAIGNGYPMAAVIGTGEVMQAAQRTFISSTYWTERIGPTAALATIRKHRKLSVPKHLIELGGSVKRGWHEAAREASLGIETSGLDPLAHFRFTHERSQEMRTAFTQLMLDKGYLASHSFYAMYAHERQHVDGYLLATKQSFAEIGQALEGNRLEALLKGPVAHSGFHRLT